MNRLYLIPTPLVRQKENPVLPEHTLEVVRNLSRFVVENVRTAQGFLQWIDHPLKPYEPEFRVLNRKTPDHEVFGFLKFLEGGDVGILSEAGAPGVADPGARLVRMAHKRGIPVVPLTGPSSILLALMGSGLNGQSFAFHGYLPRKEALAGNVLRELENHSLHQSQTQIVMETPFRNNSTLQTLLSSLHPETELCIAANLTHPEELLQTRSVARWKESGPPDLHNIPALFLFLARES
ncbi:MAG: SAM-dependent methyltransferase [Balneolaceae bacterium]